jgi:hypothetical protein
MATSLRNRLEALESCPGLGRDEPLIMFVTFVGATNGKPNGDKTRWDAWMPAVYVGHELHEVHKGESGEEAVQRIVAAMQPQPSAVIARPVEASSSYGSAVPT